MVDSTVVIATAAITAAAGFGGVAVQSWSSGRSARAVERRAEVERAIVRRHERQQTYEVILELLSDFGWSSESTSPYDVVEEFSKPFNRAAIRIRIYGSPATVAAVDAIQDAFALENRAGDREDRASASVAIWEAVGQFVIAAREDVGPRAEDGLRDVPFRPGQGPPA